MVPATWFSRRETRGCRLLAATTTQCRMTEISDPNHLAISQLTVEVGPLRGIFRAGADGPEMSPQGMPVP